MRPSKYVHLDKSSLKDMFLNDYLRIAHLKPAQVSHGEWGFPVTVPPRALKLRYASAQLDKKHKQPQDVKSCDLL